MNKIRENWQQYLLILLVIGQLIYGVYRDNREDVFVKESLGHIQQDVAIVSDTLLQLRRNVQTYGEIFQANQIELAILRKERKLLEIEHQKEQTRNRQELQNLQTALRREQEIHQRLLERARKFEK
jgi:hypothetical protein